MQANCKFLAYMVLGVIRSAGSKSAVCPAQKWLIMPQNGPFKMVYIYKKKLNIILTKPGINLIAFCFIGFTMAYSDLRSNVGKLGKLTFIGQQGF